MSHRGDGQELAELRSFGRRRGRKASPRQARLLADVLPQLALDVASAPPSRLTDLFSGQARQIWLEIGFGGGEHLLWQAEQHPDVGFIGAEPYEGGVVKVLTAIEQRGIANIRIWPDDARELLRWLPVASIARAFILFPDPWPKARHRKRRLVNRSLLDQLARVLQPAANIRAATDVGDYARTMLQAALAHPHYDWNVQGPADWRQRAADWPQTRYEAKAIAEGRRCYFFTFVRGAK